MPETLILIPTDLERRVVGPLLAGCGKVALCGFGPIAAAARTAALLATHAPTRVVLTGIAGSLDPSLIVGEARAFGAVSCFGVGAGSGEAFLPAGAMGWPQWAGDPASPETAIGDVIALAQSSSSPTSGMLLTACAASASDRDVAIRRSHFPAAVAEDMEGYGVALACKLAGVPLAIVRGISNVAGDRDTSRWKITEALQAAATLAKKVLEPAP